MQSEIYENWVIKYKLQRFHMHEGLSTKLTNRIHREGEDLLTTVGHSPRYASKTKQRKINGIYLDGFTQEY